MNIDTENFKEYINTNGLSEFSIGRITQEHKERYTLANENGEYDAEITGNLRFSANSREDFPAVGDYVAYDSYDDNNALIYHILPRKTTLERQAVGKSGEKQIIATNIDEAFIIQSVDNNFNLNRLERYLTICYGAKIKPILILSKIDLVSKEKLEELKVLVNNRTKSLNIIGISNETKDGIEEIQNYMLPRMTYCVLGSSGVGKSSLINNLLGENILKTTEISDSVNKGKHTTTHRELFILKNDAIIIDTPGMRELGITENPKGLETSYEDIINLAEECRFNNCSHENELGCAVLEALENGSLSLEVYENFKKMEREQERFTSTIAEKRKKSKAQGKLYKSIIQNKKKRKFGE